MPSREGRRTGREEARVASIVVGYVDKPEGRAALAAATAEAVRRSAGLVIVAGGRGADRATDSPAGAAPESGLPAEVTAELEARGVRYEVRPPRPDLEPADDLMTVADEVEAELIVIGLRRRSPVGKLMLGANAQRVLLDASCPVLTVKAEAER